MSNDDILYRFLGKMYIITPSFISFSPIERENGK